MAKKKAKKRTSRRTSKRTSRRTARRRTPKRTVVKRNVSVERWLLVVLAIIVVFALAFSIPSGNNGMEDTGDLTEGSVQGGQEQQASTETVVQYTCKTNSECFLVNCKSTPETVECVNVIGMETYYKNCNGIGDVEIKRDYPNCGCVNGVCQ